MRPHYFGLLPMLVLTLPVNSHAEIFKCVAENGELTFSQTPCSNTTLTVRTSTERHDEKSTDCEYVHRFAPATLREVKSGAGSSLKESRSSQQAARREARAKEQEKKQRCRNTIRSQIDRINSRMRSGYSASQGIRLRERRRDLELQMREC